MAEVHDTDVLSCFSSSSLAVPSFLHFCLIWLNKALYGARAQAQAQAQMSRGMKEDWSEQMIYTGKLSESKPDHKHSVLSWITHITTMAGRKKKKKRKEKKRKKTRYCRVL